MRLKQSDLKNYIPDLEYTKLVNGITCVIQVFHKPMFCVNVIGEKDGKVARHCYPISMDMYDAYMTEGMLIKYPNKTALQILVDKYTMKADLTKDEHLKVFYTNVAKEYKERIDRCTI